MLQIIPVCAYCQVQLPCYHAFLFIRIVSPKLKRLCQFFTFLKIYSSSPFPLQDNTGIEFERKIYHLFCNVAHLRKNILVFYRGSILVCQGCHHKIQQTGWLKQYKFIFYNSGSWISKTRLSAGLSSPEASLLGLQLVISLCPHMAFPCAAHLWCLFIFLQSHQSYWIRADPYDLV